MHIIRPSSSHHYAVACMLVVVVAMLNVHADGKLCKRADDATWYPPYCAKQAQSVPPLHADHVHDYTLVQTHVFIRHGSRNTWRQGECWTGDAKDQIKCSVTNVMHSSSNAPSNREHAYVIRHLPSGDSCPPGHLLPEGYTQLRNLGHNLARVYVGVNSTFNLLHPNEPSSSFFLRSTNMQRTMASGQTMFSAMYPPSDTNNIPMDWCTKDFDRDPLVGNSKYTCQAFNDAVKEARQSQEFHETIEAGQPLFDAFLEAANYTDATHDEIEYLFDCYFVHVCNNLPVPCPYLVNHNELPEMAWNAFVSATMSMFEWGQLSRYSIGYIVMDIAERVRALLDGQTLGEPKFLLYSGHDSTLMPLQAVLFTDGVVGWAPYASVLSLDVFRDQNNALLVRATFNNQSYHMRGCPQNPSNLCPAHVFLDLASTLVLNDIICSQPIQTKDEL